MTSYCLDNYEETEDIKDCKKHIRNLAIIIRGVRNDIFIKAFQVFKVLIDKVDKLITPMELTDEVVNTQFYDEVEDCKTLTYNKMNCRSEEYVEQKRNIHYSLVLNPLHRNTNTCHTYIGFTMEIYNRNL